MNQTLNKIVDIMKSIPANINWNMNSDFASSIKYIATVACVYGLGKEAFDYLKSQNNTSITYIEA